MSEENSNQPQSQQPVQQMPPTGAPQQQTQYQQPTQQTQQGQYQQASSQQQPSQQQGAAYQQQPQSQNATYQQAQQPPQGTPYQQAQQPQQPYQQPQPARQYPTYAKTCFGAAWSDITGSQGWLKTIALLGLINIVPILNFFVQGFAMKWSRQLVAGDFRQMPNKIIESPAFEWGFYSFVISLVASLAASLAGIILEFIPFLGALAALAISFFVYMFIQLMVLRCAVSKRFGAGFEIGKSWNALKGRFGSLIGAVFVPYVIFGVFWFVLALIIAIPTAFTAIDATRVFEYSYYGNTDLAVLTYILKLFAALIPMFLVVYVVSMFTSALMQVWILRSVAHYVARYAPEWKMDAELSDGGIPGSPTGSTGMPGGSAGNPAGDQRYVV